MGDLLPLPDGEQKPDRRPLWLRQGEEVIKDVQRRARYKTWLLVQQSKEVPEKPDGITENEYAVYLAPYQHICASDKTDFRPEGPAIGHKVHLNILPQDAPRVAEYLREQDYCHKFLSGGDADEGKIFTIYFGSAAKAMQWCPKLAEDLSSYLQSPLANSEVEYAPKVFGRFVAGAHRYTKYPMLGIRGMSCLRDFAMHSVWGQTSSDQTNLAFNNTYQALADEYGDFFYGMGSSI